MYYLAVSDVSEVEVELAYIHASGEADDLLYLKSIITFEMERDGSCENTDKCLTKT